MLMCFSSMSDKGKVFLRAVLPVAPGRTAGLSIRRQPMLFVSSYKQSIWNLSDFKDWYEKTNRQAAYDWSNTGAAQWVSF